MNSRPLDSFWMRRICQVEMPLQSGSRQSVDDTEGRCVISLRTSRRAPCCDLWLECAPTLTGWNCCVRCAYEMPAVTHPIAPLSLPRPELVCLGVHRSCCCAAAKHRSHKCHARTLLCSQDSMSNLAREWLGKRYFHTHTAHFRVR